MPYLDSHPWLTFYIDWSEAPVEIWGLLGQITSGCSRLKESPLPPAVADELKSVWFTKGARATVAIEDNSITEDEALDLYQESKESDELTDEERTEQQQEFDNVIAAFNAAIKDAFQNTGILTVRRLCEYNAMILKDIPPVDPRIIKGEIRKHPASVWTYNGAPWQELESLMDKYVNWINGFEGMQGFDPLSNGVLKAIIAHIYFEWIHPFGDGNGRTGRLLELRILVESGVPDIAAQLLTNHYNETRSQYYKKLDEISRNGGNMFPFILYALRGLVEFLDKQFDYIRQVNIMVTWRDMVHQELSGKKGKTLSRKRDVLLELAQQVEPLKIHEIRYLSPIIAEKYSGLQDQTIRRDMESLEEMELAKQTKDGWEANLAIMNYFLPISVEDESGAE